MCGLTGISSNKSVDLAKAKIVGLYNESRGGHSCGYYYDGILRHGVDKDKEWPDFIADGMCINKADSKGAKVYIGHNRWATKGNHTFENAHPFSVDNIILAHNGTLGNAFDLCNKYHIDHKDIHVDSLALCHLINKIGWSVLDEYTGYAALLVHFINEPDSLYVYHGASRKEAGKELIEERPMHFLQSKGTFYFSSMENSLMAIRDKETEEVKTLSYNKVYKFTNGKCEGSVYDVKREDANLEYHKPKVVVNNTNNFNPRTYELRQKQIGLFEKALNATDISYSPILKENKPPEAKDMKKIFFWKGRYWETIVTYNGDEMKSICRLVQGKTLIARGGDIMVEGEKHDRQIEPYWFIDGMMLRNEKCFNKFKILQGQDKAGLSNRESVNGNYAYFASKFTKYPVTCLENEGLQVADNIRWRWYHGEKRYSNMLVPKFSSRSYKIDDGKLCKVIHAKDDIVWSQRTEPPTVQKAAPVAEVLDAEALERNELIITLLPYFNTKYINLSELEDLPDEVVEAIDVYFDEYFQDHNLQLAKEERDEYSKEFYVKAVNQHSTFTEHMDQKYRANITYFLEVAINNIKKRKNDVEESKAISKALTGIVRKLPDIKPVDTIDADYEDVDENSQADVVDTLIETEQARRQFEDVMNIMAQLNKQADAMQKLDKSDLAQNIAFALYSTVADFKTHMAQDVSDKEIDRKLPWLDLPF